MEEGDTSHQHKIYHPGLQKKRAKGVKVPIVCKIKPCRTKLRDKGCACVRMCVCVCVHVCMRACVCMIIRQGVSLPEPGTAVQGPL